MDQQNRGWVVYGTVFLGLVVSVHTVTMREFFPFGDSAGDQVLESGNDRSQQLVLDKPILFYNGKFNNIYINTNGFVAMAVPGAESTYLGKMPPGFGMIAALHGDLDTGDGVGKVYYRQDASPGILQQAAEHINRAYPGEDEVEELEHTVVVTWVEVTASHNHDNNRGDGVEKQRNSFQLVIASTVTSSHAILLYPSELQYVSTQAGGSSQALLVGFSKGPSTFLLFTQPGPFDRITTEDESSVRNLAQSSNSGKQGVWVFRIGNPFFTSVVPGKVKDLPADHRSGALDPERYPATPERYPETGQKVNYPPYEPDEEVYDGGVPPQDPPHRVQYQPRDPEVLVVDDGEINVDVFSYNSERCANNRNRCSAFADCHDYTSGYCCHCRPGYYGNGVQCVSEGKPQRMNGKVNGRVYVGNSPTAVEFNNNDLHSYVVANDGRAYVAISTIPDTLGPSLQPLPAMGGVIGWAFALEQPGYKNGFSIIGGEFTRQAEVTFLPGQEKLTIKQVFSGIDEHDHLVVSTTLEGRIPEVPRHSTVQIEPYSEIYQYSSNLITSSSTRDYTVSLADGSTITKSYQWRQSITFQSCPHDETSRPPLPSQMLSVDQVFVLYDSNNQLIRYAMSNKIGDVNGGPQEEENACFTGRHGCDTNAVCRPQQGTQYTCECSAGFTGDGRSCYDIDECLGGARVCGPHSICNNQPGTFRCECDSGYHFASDGHTCTEVGRPVDHCEAGSHDCDLSHRAHCSYTGGSSYTCSCLTGFHGDGRVCQDVDECQSDKCHRDAVCSNTQGSFTCLCRPGYYGDGFFCSSERTKSQCETLRDQLLGPQRPWPVALGQYVPTCDSQGAYEATQCHGSIGQCWCVDRNGKEIPRTRTRAGRPLCEDQVGPTPRPGVYPPPAGTNLLYAQSGRIDFVPMENYDMIKTQAKTVLHLPEKVIIAVAYDCVEKMVYWTDITSPSISKASLQGGEPISVITSDLESPEGISIDPLSRNVFWTDSMKDRIEVASLDGTQRRVLIDTDLVNPRAIIVDPVNGIMFWTDWNREAPKIETASMDGTNRKVLVKNDLVLPNGLIYDSQSSQLCWADAGSHMIECMNPVQGTRRKVKEGIQYPFGMTSYGKNIYYTDWLRDAVVVVDKHSSKETDEFLPQKRSRIYGITMAPAQCHSGHNYCSVNNGGCTHLCLATPSGRSCVCPNQPCTDLINHTSRRQPGLQLPCAPLGVLMSPGAHWLSGDIMASLHMTNLAFAWEKYMDCRLGGADLQVCLQCLESFLCLFYSVRHLHSSHVNRDALKFCVDMSGASNTLAREFLTDVHQLCSAVAQRAEFRGEEDEEESHMVALGEYLVRGRGYLLLSALDSIIDQELTCREELLTLLLSLLPLVWKIPVQEEKAPGFILPSLLDVFLSWEVKSVHLRVRQDHKTGPGPQYPGRRSHLEGSISSWKAQRRSRQTAQRSSIRDARRSQLSTSDTDDTSQEVTSGGAAGARSRRPHGSTIRVSCQYHRSEAPLLPSTPFPPPEMTMASPFLSAIDPPRSMGGLHPGVDTETLTEPAAVSIFNRMENSPFDLCHVLLSLLEKVCKFDMSINHAPGLTVSVVPTLTEILTEFGDCCGPGGSGVEELAAGWTEEPIALVQRMLLRTILHLMSVDVDQSESLPDSLRRSLTDLLRATLKIRSCLERQADPFAPRTKKTLQEVQDDFSFSRWRHRALLLPELLEGVLQVLLGCLQASAPNPFFFSQALELLHEFIQHRGLELIESTVLRLEVIGRDSEMGGEAADRLRGLIAGVLKIVSTVKKAKSEQLHQSVCARRRHRRCEYSYFLHHHRDLSGLPVSAFKQAARRNPFEELECDSKDEGGDVVRYPERCCCLAACSHQCLRLLQRLSPSGPGALQVLAGVQAVGICCCMDPRSVVGPMLHAFQAPGLRCYQAHVLSVLSRLILDQLGGGQPSERAKLASCNICTLDSSQLPGLEETLQQGDVGVSSPSFSYRSQGILPSGGGAEDMLWKWDALEAYQGLVFGEDRALSQQLAGHVCHLTLRGNVVVQWQLYTHIFNPVLQRGVELAHHAQQLGVSSVCSQVCSQHSLCLPVDVLLVYLHTLPTLLQSRVIRDLFLSCNGLNQVTELIYLDQTRSWALKVFETLILGVGADDLDQEQHIETPGGGGDPAGTDELGSRGTGGDGGPQTLSKFYEGLKEACPRRKSGPGVLSGSGRSRGEAHLNTINLFLCVAFLSVSKEADSDRDSANDSEDTSGYDSTASEPLIGRLPCLSPDNVALPSKEQVQRAADVWSVCRWIYLASPVFQRQFYRLGGLDVCSRLMALVIQKLTTKTKDGKAKKYREFKGEADSPAPSPICLLTQVESGSSLLGVEDLGQDPAEVLRSGQGEAKEAQKDPSGKLEEDWPLQSIRLLEALLAICLHSANSPQQRIDAELSCQLQSVDETLVEVRDQLSRSGVVNSDLATPLFDSLLRVALAEVCSSPAPLQEQPDRTAALSVDSVLPAGDLSDTEEGSEAQGCVEALVEEEGYEADSESNPEDMAKQEEVVKVESAGGAGEGLAGEGVWPGGGLRGLLLFPEICLMELQLLAAGTPDLEVLDHVFHSLLGALKANTRNAALLYHQGGVKTILTGFQNILTQSDPRYKECQTVLIQLLVAMVSQQITAEELALLIRLFLEKTPPTEILLKGVLQIVQASVDMEPLYFLSFPMILGVATSTGGSSPGSRQNAGGKGGGVGGLLWRGGKQSPGRRDEIGGEPPRIMRTSPWYVAPLHLPLVGQNCWPHMASGFSSSIWMKVIRPDDSQGHGEREVGTCSPPDAHMDPAGPKGQEGLAHLVSMGSKSLMLQVWADLSTGSFTFRICIDPNDEMKAGLLAQAQSREGLVTPGRWHHLGISYTQQPEGKKTIHGRLVLWVDGVSKCEVSLDYTLPRKSSLSSDSNKSFCLLGHCIGHSDCPAGGNYHMGTVLLFNGSRIGSEEAFYLYASGPDLTSIMPCKYGKPSGSFSKQVTNEGLKCATVRDMLMKDLDTAALIECLSVVFTPSNPRVYTIYEPVIRLKGQAKTTVSQRPFSSKEVQSAVLETHILRALTPAEPKSLQNVIHKMGGTGTFVFLFARAVELSDSEQTQALALQVLLLLAKHNQHRINEMDCYHGYSMIHQVLIKSKCIVGYHILKTLLDGCCSSPVLTLQEDGYFRLDMETTAVVQDIRLLSEVLLDWKIWAKAQVGVWEMLLAALQLLIRVHHPWQVFNIKQFLRAQVVHHFLLTCQVLQEHQEPHLTSIPQEVCLSFVKIIQEVLGSPPDLELLRLVYNFLLAVHPPTNTYVCHTPTSFYFSLHIDGKLYQEKVKSLMYQMQSSAGGSSTGNSVVSLSPSGLSQAPPPEGTLHPDASLQPGEEVHVLSPGPGTNSSTHLSPLLGHGVAEGTKEDGEGAALAPHHDLGSTETLKRGGEDQLLSSCESAKTICYSREGREAPLSPSISVEGVEDEVEVEDIEDVQDVEVGGKEVGGKNDIEGDSNEVDSLSESSVGGADGSVGGFEDSVGGFEDSVGGAESDDRFDWESEEAPRRPDSLKGITSFQRSSSNLASLGLAFPAQNGSLVLGRWQSVADRTTLPEDWESYTYSPGYDKSYSKDSCNDRCGGKDCLVLICCGLYDLLRGVLLLLPDLMLEEVMDKLIQPEALIVLVNHPSSFIQQGVMKLLDAYFSRAFKEQKEKFLKNHGFSLLANQLYLHKGSHGLVEVFLEMLFGRPVGLEEDLDLEDMENISPFRKRCIIPLLGLLENSLYDNSLVHNMLCMFLQLVNACPKLADILLDHGLIYVLFNTLSTLNGMEHSIPLNDYKLLVVDIQQLLVAVTIHSCSSSGSQYFRIIEDLTTLLGFLQTSKMRRTQEMAVALQFRVLQSAIEFIKTTADQDPQNPSISVNVSPTPHQAIYQKRRSIAGGRRFSLVQSDSLLTRMRSVASDELSQMMQRRMSLENPIRDRVWLQTG
ncbi:hypothetical protein DPEC_G00325490 [Dallia pectoralis]|uniref:Uncharacterized protein n=1 Tax=Dallia pectoralis TaxID=75939 RepID=A0ACC2F7L1_DALPE|nr:hypothetical protein DPEC_G00325490 [Dallia pectoralis]